MINSFDDGMQFADTAKEVAWYGDDTSKTLYRVYTHSENGIWTQYKGTDKSRFDAEIAKHEAHNARARASKSAWGPKVVEYFTEIIEPVAPVAEEVVEVAEVAIEEPSEVVEQNVEAVEASTEVEAIEGEIEVVSKPFGKVAETIYKGDDLTSAKASVASQIGEVDQVYTKIRGVISHSSGLSWDSYDQYCKDLKSGKFDAAFERDWHLSMDESAEARTRHQQAMAER